MSSGPESGAPVGLAGETDGDLLIYMSLAADDPSSARAAWGEFYRRHVDYLYAVCMRAYGPLLGGEAGVCDLVADTFKRAYEHAGTYEDGDIADADRRRRRTRAWLGRIAQRLMQSALRSETPPRHLDPQQWQLVAYKAPAATADSEKSQLAGEALLALSERERLVLQVTLQWHRAGEEHQRLPNDVTAELARTLGTTPENLRQIRRRALRKVETMLRAGKVRNEY